MSRAKRTSLPCIVVISGVPVNRATTAASKPDGNHQCAWMTSGASLRRARKPLANPAPMYAAIANRAPHDAATSCAMVPVYARVSRDRGA